MANNQYQYFDDIALEWFRARKDERWYSLSDFYKEVMMSPGLAKGCMKRLAKQNLLEYECATLRYYCRAVRGID